MHIPGSYFFYCSPFCTAAGYCWLLTHMQTFQPNSFVQGLFCWFPYKKAIEILIIQMLSPERPSPSIQGFAAANELKIILVVLQKKNPKYIPVILNFKLFRNISYHVYHKCAISNYKEEIVIGTQCFLFSITTFMNLLVLVFSLYNCCFVQFKNLKWQLRR